MTLRFYKRATIYTWEKRWRWYPASWPYGSLWRRRLYESVDFR